MSMGRSMDKLDLPGAHTTAMVISDELHYLIYSFDTSEHDGGTLGATYADLLHHYILAIVDGEEHNAAALRCSKLVYEWYMNNSEVVSQDEFVEAGVGFINYVLPTVRYAMGQVPNLVIARVGVLLEPMDGKPVILLEFCEKIND